MTQQQNTKPKEETLLSFIAGNSGSNVDKLSTDAQTLFGFFALIVDIKYRVKYAGAFEDERDQGYNDKQFNKVLADHVSPVDDGLLGY